MIFKKKNKKKRVYQKEEKKDNSNIRRNVKNIIPLMQVIKLQIII
jgi:hypothetical protein